MAPWIIAAALLYSPLAPASELDGDSYEHRKLEVRFTVPEGWQLSRQTGYPSLLAFVSRGTARISLSFTRLVRKQKLIQVVTSNARALEAIGLRLEPPKRADRLGRTLWHVTAGTSDGRRVNQQLYVPAGEVIYVLTLSCDTSALRQAVVELDYLLASMKFKHWTLPEEDLVRERSQPGGGAPGKLPTTKPTGGLDDLSSGGSLPSEGDGASAGSGSGEVEDRARGGRTRPAPARASSRPASRPTPAAPDSASSSGEAKPKLPTTVPRGQTR